jgi:hypothetical protein
LTQDSVYNYGYQKFESPIWGTWDWKGQSGVTTFEWTKKLRDLSINFKS